jgi:regulator of PEP synthase PpsR (kinase-PPPase family)
VLQFLPTEKAASMEEEQKILWIVSDGTGRTVHQVIKAALYQFANIDIEYRFLREVRTEEKIFEVIERVKRESGMIVYTIVSESNRRLMHRLSVENHILSVDLFGPLLSTLQKFFQKVPIETPGLTFMRNRDYFRMVDAVDFTIKHDDGASVSDIDRADIILIGPSRVGKTPLAVYLAYMGWKVANIPLIWGNPLPEVLERIRFKVFCLIIEPAMLRLRRAERIRKLGDPEIEGYTEQATIMRELQHCREISQDGKKWALIDISYKTIEDQAKEIIRLVSI